MKYITALFLTIVVHATWASDSLRTETVNGKFVIVHKVEQGQTLFSIAKKYGVTVAEVKSANPALSQLKSGTEIYIPFKRAGQGQNQPNPVEEQRGTDEDPEGLSHIVKQGETLFRISKMYKVSVSEISQANNLGQAGIKVGQELIIPQTANSQRNLNTPASQTSPPTTIPNKVEKKTSATGYPSISESGMARLDESIPNDFYIVHHKTAIPGTIVLIKSKETGNTVHAKVAGTSKTSDLLVVNKKVFEKLETKSNTLAVEIFYTPEE